MSAAIIETVYILLIFLVGINLGRFMDEDPQHAAEILRKNKLQVICIIVLVAFSFSALDQQRIQQERLRVASVLLSKC